MRFTSSSIIWISWEVIIELSASNSDLPKEKFQGELPLVVGPRLELSETTLLVFLLGVGMGTEWFEIFIDFVEVGIELEVEVQVEEGSVEKSSEVPIVSEVRFRFRFKFWNGEFIVLLLLLLLLLKSWLWLWDEELDGLDSYKQGLEKK